MNECYIAGAFSLPGESTYVAIVNINTVINFFTIFRWNQRQINSLQDFWKCSTSLNSAPASYNNKSKKFLNQLKELLRVQTYLAIHRHHLQLHRSYIELAAHFH